MLTPEEVIQIIVSRKMSLRPTEENLWVAETATGTRLHRQPQATIALAVEKAEQTILLSLQRETSEEDKQIISHLQRGKFYIKPRKTEIDVLFDAFLINETLIVRDKPTFREAAISAVAAIAASAVISDAQTSGQTRKNK